jgi:hypothetical protein
MHRRRQDAPIPPVQMAALTTPSHGFPTKDDDVPWHDSETSTEAMKSNEQLQATVAPEEEDNTTLASAQPTWTVLSDYEIKSLLIVASFAAAVSPFSTSTYYPAVIAIAHDLGVSVSQINLTISSYQVRSPDVRAGEEFDHERGANAHVLTC